MHVFTYVCQTCIQHGQYRVLLGPMQKKNLPLGMCTPEGTMEIEPVYKICLEQMWNATSHLVFPLPLYRM